MTVKVPLLANMTEFGKTKLLDTKTIERLGFNIVIYLAALQDIPQEVMEAASIDGAGKWAKFWHVTVPTVRPVTIFLLVPLISIGAAWATSLP